MIPDDIRNRLRKKAGAISRLFSSPEGQEVLSLLDEEFLYGDMFDNDPHRTAYNLGARDVVIYIHQLLRHSENDG